MPASWASEALKGVGGVGMGAQGLGWGGDPRQSLSENLTVFPDPCYTR